MPGATAVFGWMNVAKLTSGVIGQYPSSATGANDMSLMADTFASTSPGYILCRRGQTRHLSENRLQALDSRAGRVPRPDEYELMVGP